MAGRRHQQRVLLLFAFFGGRPLSASDARARAPPLISDARLKRDHRTAATTAVTVCVPTGRWASGRTPPAQLVTPHSAQ